MPAISGAGKEMWATLSLVWSRSTGGAHERSLVICLAEVPGRAFMLALGGGIKSQGRLLKVRLLPCPFSGKQSLWWTHCMLPLGAAALFVLADPVAVRFVPVLA